MNQWDIVRPDLVSDDEETNKTWKNNSLVALIQWVPNLTRVIIPTALREALISGQAMSSSYLLEFQGLDDAQLVEIAQWSDLVLFDYLTGNYDRLASMLVSDCF